MLIRITFMAVTFAAVIVTASGCAQSPVAPTSTASLAQGDPIGRALLRTPQPPQPAVASGAAEMAPAD